MIERARDSFNAMVQRGFKFAVLSTGRSVVVGKENKICCTMFNEIKTVLYLNFGEGAVALNYGIFSGHIYSHFRIVITRSFCKLGCSVKYLEPNDYEV